VIIGITAMSAAAQMAAGVSGLPTPQQGIFLLLGTILCGVLAAKSEPHKASSASKKKLQYGNCIATVGGR
jgi:hypothetical protein